MALKKKELKQLPKVEMEKRLLELKKELLMLRGQAGSGAPLQSPGLVKSTKRNIARIHTYLKTKTDEKKGGKK